MPPDTRPPGKNEPHNGAGRAGPGRILPPGELRGRGRTPRPRRSARMRRQGERAAHGAETGRKRATPGMAERRPPPKPAPKANSTDESGPRLKKGPDETACGLLQSCQNPKSKTQEPNHKDQRAKLKDHRPPPPAGSGITACRCLDTCRHAAGTRHHAGMPCSAKPAASPQFSLWFFKRLPGAALPARFPIQRPAAGGFPPADPASASRHRGRHGRPPPRGKGTLPLAGRKRPLNGTRAAGSTPGIIPHAGHCGTTAFRTRPCACGPLPRRPGRRPCRGRLLPSRLATAAAVPVPTNGAKTTPPAGERAYHAPRPEPPGTRPHGACCSARTCSSTRSPIPRPAVRREAACRGHIT